MKKLVFAGFLAVWMAVGTWAFSQSMPGLQTSFPVGTGLKAMPSLVITPPPTVPPYRISHPTPTVVRNKFYPLTPAPKPTPLRGRKLQDPSKTATATVLGPRQIHYKSLYQDSH